MLRAWPLSYSDSSAPDKQPDRTAARPSGLVDETCSTRVHMDIGLPKPAARITTRAAPGEDSIGDGPSTRCYP